MFWKELNIASSSADMTTMPLMACAPPPCVCGCEGKGSMEKGKGRGGVLLVARTVRSAMDGLEDETFRKTVRVRRAEEAQSRPMSRYTSLTSVSHS